MEKQPQIAVLDYGMGNLKSVFNAFQHVGAAVRLVEDPRQLKDAEGLVFPGQGAIVDCMVRLRETGFDQVIRDWIQADQPFFGICLGLQALFSHSEEGNTPGLDIFKGEVKRFRLPHGQKIPHMGWNTVQFREGSSLVDSGGLNGNHFYFVHSYFAVPVKKDLIWGETDYGGRFCAAIRYKNCHATQFHPEKSQTSGLQLYRNFLKLTRQQKSS